MLKIFQLHPHKHTGKLLSHHHTSYPGLILLLIISILALAKIDQTALADDYILSAKVSATIPTQAAVIRVPTADSIVSTAELTVAGECEIVSPTILIVIYSNDNLLGSTMCDSSGLFHIDVALSPGNNSLVAKSVNITDDYGPDSTAVNVTYSAPAAQESTTTTPTETPTYNDTQENSTTPETAPLKIISKHTYILYGPSEDAMWEGYFEGGAPPYSLTIDWGDNTIKRATIADNSENQFRHKYNTAKNYSVNLTVSDTAGQQVTQQLVAVTPYIAAVQNNTTETATPIFTQEQVVKAGVYTTTGLLVTTTAVWVGTGIHAAGTSQLATVGQHTATRSIRIRSSRRK